MSDASSYEPVNIKLLSLFLFSVAVLKHFHWVTATAFRLFITVEKVYHVFEVFHLYRVYITFKLHLQLNALFRSLLKSTLTDFKQFSNSVKYILFSFCILHCAIFSMCIWPFCLILLLNIER